MKIKLKGHLPRTEASRKLWSEVAGELRAGLTPTEVAKRHINPLTKKPYTREHIYWIIEKVKTKKIN